MRWLKISRCLKCSQLIEIGWLSFEQAFTSWKRLGTTVFNRCTWQLWTSSVLCLMKNIKWGRLYSLRSPRAGERAHLFTWHRSSRPQHQAETSGELAGEKAPRQDYSALRTRGTCSQAGEEELPHFIALDVRWGEDRKWGVHGRCLNMKQTWVQEFKTFQLLTSKNNVYMWPFFFFKHLFYYKIFYCCH